MNAPDRFELFILPDGVSKWVLKEVLESLTFRVTIAEDPRLPSAATISIQKEDHTLAGMLRSQLLLDKRVIFAGYKVPHPLDHMFQLKLQTKDVPQPLGCTPVEALRDACKALLVTLGKMRESFQEDFIRARAFAQGPGERTLLPPLTTFGGGQTPFGAGQTGGGGAGAGAGMGYVPAAALQRDIAGGRTPAANVGVTNPYDL